VGSEQRPYVHKVHTGVSGCGVHAGQREPLYGLEAAMNDLDILFEVPENLVKLVMALPMRDRIPAVDRIAARRKDLDVLHGSMLFRIVYRGDTHPSSFHVGDLDK